MYNELAYNEALSCTKYDLWNIAGLTPKFGIPNLDLLAADRHQARRFGQFSEKSVLSGLTFAPVSPLLTGIRAEVLQPAGGRGRGPVKLTGQRCLFLKILRW